MGGIKQTGDGFFAAFTRPEAAIQAAIAIQRALLAEVVAPDVRIDAHTAGAFHPAGNDADYAGQGVHMAARIGAAAEAGEILVSSESLDGALEGTSLSDPRAMTLKGFSEPVQIRSVRWQ